MVCYGTAVLQILRIKDMDKVTLCPWHFDSYVVYVVNTLYSVQCSEVAFCLLSGHIEILLEGICLNPKPQYNLHYKPSCLTKGDGH